MSIAFRKVREPFGWMSNMSPHTVKYEGLTYPTAEALFQALRFEDEAIRTEIRWRRNPMAAKAIARSYDAQMTVQRLSAEDLNNMRLVLRLKIEQHDALRTELLESGDEEIIEDCTNRRHGSGLFWGAALVEETHWIGENHLGKLWMELRAKLRCAANCTQPAPPLR